MSVNVFITKSNGSVWNELNELCFNYNIIKGFIGFSAERDVPFNWTWKSKTGGPHLTLCLSLPFRPSFCYISPRNCSIQRYGRYGGGLLVYIICKLYFSLVKYQEEWKRMLKRLKTFWRQSKPTLIQPLTNRKVTPLAGNSWQIWI